MHEWIGKRIPVLDHGYIELVDVMGNDFAVLASARTSTGLEALKPHTPDEQGNCKVCKGHAYKGQQPTEPFHPNHCAMADRQLLRYLYRHRHSTPFEAANIKVNIKAPIFVARQWMRHRSACLSGDTELHFDLPGGVERKGNQLYKLSVKEVFNRFKPTQNTQRPDKQGNPHHKRERVQSMLLRSVNEETGEIYHTNIVDIWESGEKEVFHVKLEDGTWFECSKDHRIFTNTGWFKLEDLNKGHLVIVIGPGRGTGVTPHLREADEGIEMWHPILDWEDYYEVSDQGRVRRIAGGRGSKRGIKKNTVINGRAVVSLNRPGEQVTTFVHCLVMEAFVGPRPAGMECCHNDGNSLNNWLDNLRWDTPRANAHDRVQIGATTALRSSGIPIVSIVSKGVEMTYDLKVAGPWHNFSAGGAVVHNSINEYSARYSEPITDYYIPDFDERPSKQSKSNKQGSAGNLSAEDEEAFIASLNSTYANSQAAYEQAVASGMALEVARLHMPVGQYTRWQWGTSLRMFFHFLGLRAASDAQWEIRQYAEALTTIAATWVPWTLEAWEDYELYAHTFSKQEMEVLRAYVAQHGELPDPQGSSRREINAFKKALR